MKISVGCAGHTKFENNVLMVKLMISPFMKIRRKEHQMWFEL